MTARPVVALLLVLASAAGVLWWAIGSRSAAPPAPVGPGAAAVAGAAAAVPFVVGAVDVGAVPAATPAAPEPTVRERGDARIQGRLLDAAGAPLGGCDVSLSRRGKVGPWPPPDTGFLLSPAAGRTTAGTDGAFGFPDLVPGDYHISVIGWSAAAATCSLAPGSVWEVDLRLPVDVALVTGSVWGEGATDPEHHVAFYRGKHELFTRPVRDGEIRCLLAAGRYELRAGAEWVRKHELWFSRHELVVPPGVARVSWRHEFGGTPCEVFVRAPPGGDRSAIGVDVNSKEVAADRSRDTAYTAKAGRVGKPVRLLLPPGTWRIHVHGDEMTAMPEREVVVERDSPLLRVEFDAEPAAAVSLALRDGRGSSISIAPELMPPVVAAGRECPCLQAKEGTRTPKLRFPHVPLGAGELRLEDRLLDGVHTFLPFEPLPPVALLVQAGQPNALELTVQRRPLVDLRACDATGREDGNACIAVFLGERRVRGRDEVFAQRFAAWLPPGDYRVVVDRNGALREHPLAVARTDVTVRYRP